MQGTVPEDFPAQIQRAVGAVYHIESELGGAGMSRVFLARDLGLGRPVVIKVLPPELASHASAERFQREILVTARLEHPHIIPVLTAGATDDILYYVTPYIPGETLRARLRSQGKLPLAEVVSILTEVLDAIEFAHARGVVHRDIKPENILVAHGHVRVADFGIAALVDEATEANHLTRTGSGLGTSGYMAPEQIRGSHDIDGRADIYAIGVLAYELLTGELPVAQSAMTRRPWRVSPTYRRVAPDVPRYVWDAIARALAPEREDRFASAHDFRTAIANTRRRDRSLLAVAATIGCALILIGIVAADGGLPAFRGPRRDAAAGLDSNRVVVLPFDVLGVDSLLGRAVPASVARYLDGAGPLRASLLQPPPGATASGASASTVSGIARRANARLVIVGTVARLGDSLDARAQIIDAARDRTIAPVEVRSAFSNPELLTEALTLRLLASINDHQAIGAVRGVSLARGSMTALWWYLKGEQHLRANEREAADTAYREAQRNDSTSPIGLRRMRTILRGISGEWDSTSMSYAVRAGALNHGLGPRDSMLVLADSLYGAIVREPYSPRRLSRLRRWFAILDEAVSEYPYDAEVHYERGEARYHLGDLVGVPAESALASFEAAIRLDRGYASPYFHAVELSTLYHGPDSAAALARQYLRIKPQDPAYRFGLAVLSQDSDSASAARMVDTLSLAELERTADLLQCWPDRHGLYRRTLVRIVDAARRTGIRPAQAAQARRLALAFASRRGWLDEAREFGGATASVDAASAFAILAAINASMRTSALAPVFAGWLKSGNMSWIAYALPWWAARRDTTSLGEAARLAAARTGPLDTAIVGSMDWAMSRYVAVAARAQLAAARGDTALASRLFSAAPDSLCPGRCILEQIARANLLVRGGHPADALALLDAHPPPLAYPSAADMIWREAHARASAAARDSPREMADRRLIARFWGTADPPWNSPLAAENVLKNELPPPPLGSPAGHR